MRWNSPELASLIDDARRRFIAAGIASPHVDAPLIAAALLGESSHLAMRFYTPEQIPDSFTAEFYEAVERREKREPLQHILGSAPFGVHDLKVGPGVFIPRPETEVLAEWAVSAYNEFFMSLPEEVVEDPLFESIIVDLGTGSGALAIYLDQRVHADVIFGVEKSPAAIDVAEENAENFSTAVRIIQGDMTDPKLLESYSGKVAMVVSNPPYVPYVPPESGELDPEVYYDPEDAVFSGVDGMDAIRGLIPVAERLLMPGGLLGIEHDDSTAAATRGLVEKQGCFENIRNLKDLTGRERFVTASKLHSK